MLRHCWVGLRLITKSLFELETYADVSFCQEDDGSSLLTINRSVTTRRESLGACVCENSLTLPFALEREFQLVFVQGVARERRQVPLDLFEAINFH